MPEIEHESDVAEWLEKNRLEVDVVRQRMHVAEPFAILIVLGVQIVNRLSIYDDAT